MFTLDIGPIPTNLSATAELDRYGTYLRQALPLAFRRELESRVESLFENGEESIRNQIPDIFQDMQIRLFQDYMRFRTPQSTQTASFMASTSGQSNATISEETIPEETIPEETIQVSSSVEQVRSSFGTSPDNLQLPTAPENPLAQFDGRLYQLSAIPTVNPALLRMDDNSIDNSTLFTDFSTYFSSGTSQYFAENG
jgi:hypothetical protein